VRFLSKATNKVPVVTKEVGMRNNILHTLFQKVSMFINDTLITVSPENYAYKAYFTNTLTFGQECKESHLGTQGYVSDSSGYFDNTNDSFNVGFYLRNKVFRDEMDTTKNFRETGSQFIGRLLHDLIACETGSFLVALKS